MMESSLSFYLRRATAITGGIISVILVVVSVSMTTRAFAASKDTLAAMIDGFSKSPTASDAGVWVTNGQINIEYDVPSLATNSAFATFTLHLKGQGSSSTSTTYPVSIAIGNNGNPPQNLSIAPGATPVSLTAQGIEKTTTMTIAVDCTTSACPSGNGETIDRHVTFTGPTGNNGIVTQVQIHVTLKLVIPKPCLSVATIVTDEGWTQKLTDTDLIVIANGKQANTVRATSPFGQHSLDVAVVNSPTCATGAQNFDLGLALDPRYETNPNDNPGNAVFTYFSSLPIDLSSTPLPLLSSGTPMGQALCLSGISLDPGSSMLARAHMQIKRGLNIQTDPLWTTTPAPGPFVFSGAVYASGSNCTGLPIVPAETFSLPYDIR